jgi:signal transduction histidine kinase
MLTDSRFIEDASLRVMVTTEGFNRSIELGQGQGIYKDYRGVEVIGVFRWLPDLDIVLLTEMDTAEMNAPLRQLENQLYKITMAITLTAICVAFFLSRIMGGPINTLISGVGELAQGQLGYRFTDIDSDMGPVKLALNEMAGQLQDTIETRDTYNQQLVGANKELDAFAYSVSHDLRAPLRAIDGFSQALTEDYLPLLDDKGRSYLTHLRKGAQEMGGLIDDLLTLSRSTRGEVDWQEVNVSVIAKNIGDHLIEDEPTRIVEFNIDPEVVAWGDERLLKIVLENLLGNAWKYTNKKDFTKISLTASNLNETTVEICIKDNGAGFNNQYADKLFEPFQRLHRKDEFIGSGIGLSTVQRIVTRLGGTVRGEGEIEAGASFFISLQRKEPTWLTKNPS